MQDHSFTHDLLAHAGFLRSYHAGEFWLADFPIEQVRAILSWDDLNACLSCNRITNDRLRLSTVHGHDQLNRRVFRQVKDSFGRPTDQLLLHELHAALAEGATAVLEAVNEMRPQIGAITQGLANHFAVRSSANVYLSFGAISGFGVHNDDHDVLVIQLDGQKQWQFFSAPDTAGQTVPPPAKATVHQLLAPGEQDRGEQLILRAGQIMYIPKGTWHDVTALHQHSLHLTISLVHPTLLDFVQWSLRKATVDLSYYDIRPTQQLDQPDRLSKLELPGLLATCRAHLEQLVCEERLQAFCQRFHAGRAINRVEACLPWLNQARPQDRFQRLSADVVEVQSAHADGLIDIFSLGSVVRLTPLQYRLLAQLPCSGFLAGSALSSDPAEWAETALALHALLDMGLIAKQPAPSDAP